MKTNWNITIEKELKKSFKELAERLGTNPTNLLNMMMKEAINGDKLTFTTKSKLDLEIEPFSEEELNDLKNSPKIQESFKKLDKIFSKE